jgi:hypothetical protein
MGRRAFIGAALGGAAAGGGLLTGIGRVSAGEEKTPGAYREDLKTPIVGHFQVIVAGGGPGGFIAALAAARSGAETLLVERYSFLGGNGTAGLMTCYNGFRNQRPPEALQTVKGIPAEYIAELVRLGGVADVDPYPKGLKHDLANADIPYTVGFDPEAAKVAMLKMVAKEGVKLRLHSWVVAPMLDGSRVTGVIVESKSGRQAITADCVIDATGDGDVAARAGAAVMSPVENGKGDRMGMSLMYQLGGMPPTGNAQEGIRIGDRVVKWGPAFQGDGIDVENLTRAEIETRLKLWDDVRKMRAKQPTVYLAQTATGIGVRETRRVVGEYVLSEQDAIKGTRFDDVIAISSNPLPDYHGRRFFLQHEGFDIPYRSLVPKTIDGLLLTGRCISCEQAPFQSARSMAPAMAIGHASGCAAAMSAKRDIPPRKLDVNSLQKLLKSQNAELRL